MGRNSIHKKAIYVLLALVMVLCMFQLSGVAALAEGSGGGSASSEAASSETAGSEASSASSETASSEATSSASSETSSSEATSSASSETSSSASSETASSEADGKVPLLLTTVADSDKVVESGDCGNNLKWKITQDSSGKRTLTISGSGTMWNYDGKYNLAPWYYYGVKELVLSDEMTSIGNYAFYGFNCTGSLTIPDSVTSIGSSAFENCSGFIGDLTIPDKVTSIGNNAFSLCCKFNGNLTIGNSVTSIGDNAFLSCSAFTGSLTIPNSVTSIGSSAFESCSAFTGNLTIPDSVTSIGDYAFYSCTGFNGNLTIGNSVTSIENGTFKNCSGFIGDLTIPDKVTSIGNDAFKQCEGLTKAIIPASVTKIGDSAFKYLKTGSIIYNLSDVDMDESHYSGATLGPVYTVTTFVDGKIASKTKVVGDGKSKATIADPVKEGFKFNGWYADSDFKTAWTKNGDVATSSFNIYAKFQKVLNTSDITSVKSASAITYDGTTKKFSVKVMLSGYNPSGGTTKAETATATAEVTSANAGTYTNYTLSDIILNNPSNYTLTGVTEINVSNSDNYNFGITINKAATTITIEAGSETVNKTYGDADFSLPGISNAANTEMIYKSDTESVAVVDNNGEVTIKGAGTAKITVSLPTVSNYKADSKTLTVNVAKANAVITISSGSETVNKTYGDADFALTGITNTGDGIRAYKSENEHVAVADNNGNVSIKGAGTAKITVSLPETSNYKAATNQTVTVVVAKANAVITISSGSETVNKTYGDAAFTLTGISHTGDGTMTYKSDSEYVAVADNNGKVSIKGAGTAIITVSLPETTNYKSTSQTMTVTVAQKAVTITAKDKTIVVGQEIPVFSSPLLNTDYMVAGLVGSDQLTGNIVMKYAGTPDNTKTGKYPIEISGVTAGGNYIINFVSGNLAITSGYTVSFDSNGGNSIEPITNIYYGTTVILPVPTRSDYHFGGWYNGNTLYTNNTSITASVTLTAKWIHNSGSTGGNSDTNSKLYLPSSVTDTLTGSSADLTGAVMPADITRATLSVTQTLQNGNTVPQASSALHLTVSDAKMNVIGTPILYNLKLLDQNGNPITGFGGSVKVKLPLPLGLHGTPHVFRYEESAGNFTDMRATLENGFLVFSTDHFSYYAIAGVGDSITLDTQSYQMPVNGKYQIGIKFTGTKASSVKFYSTNNNIASVTKLKNGNYQVIGMKPGTAYIMFDVYDNKNKLLTHASVRINIKIGAKPKGDSTRQIGIF